MPKVTYNGATYECAIAIKGATYVELRDSTGATTYRFDGVASFSSFTISDGNWTDPAGAQETRATATLSSGDLVVTTDDEIGNGSIVKFAAPCNCSAVTGSMVVNNVAYSIVDTLDAAVPGKDAWCAGAMISFIINKTNKKAYIQNQAMVGSVVKWDSISVPLSGWVSSSDGGYKNTVAVTGVLPTDNPHSVDITRSGTAANIKAAMTAFSKVYKITTYNGSIELWAPYAKPTATFSIRMEATR